MPITTHNKQLKVLAKYHSSQEQFFHMVLKAFKTLLTPHPGDLYLSWLKSICLQYIIVSEEELTVRKILDK